MFLYDCKQGFGYKKTMERTANMKTIIVDGVAFEEVKPVMNRDIRIVILQRGWCMVGEFIRDGSDCLLKNASVIRRWGTSKGLGELAENGPLSETILDKCHGDVSFDYLTVVATISCAENKWAEKL